MCLHVFVYIQCIKKLIFIYFSDVFKTFSVNLHIFMFKQDFFFFLFLFFSSSSQIVIMLFVSILPGISHLCKEDAILATNSLFLDITSVMDRVHRPEVRGP